MAAATALDFAKDCMRFSSPDLKTWSCDSHVT